MKKTLLKLSAVVMSAACIFSSCGKDDPKNNDGGTDRTTPNNSGVNPGSSDAESITHSVLTANHGYSPVTDTAPYPTAHNNTAAEINSSVETLYLSPFISHTLTAAVIGNTDATVIPAYTDLNTTS